MLGNTNLQRATVLAEAREQTVDEVRARFSAYEIAKGPTKFSPHLKVLRRAPLKRTGIEDGLAFVELADGHVFYSYTSKGNHRRQFQYVADTLPDCITPDTFLASIDVAQRYLRDVLWPPRDVVPEAGGNIVEFGAYLGHKTVRFAEELAGTAGRVLAVEMIPENAEILRRNVEVNGLADKIDIAVVGVWDKDEEREIFSKGRQRNAIDAIDKLDDGERVRVHTRTMSAILADWGVKPVDLAYLTVNGAEVDVLRACDLQASGVQALYVVAAYTRDEGSNADLCRNLLVERGYRLHPLSQNKCLIATL